MRLLAHDSRVTNNNNDFFKYDFVPISGGSQKESGSGDQSRILELLGAGSG